MKMGLQEVSARKDIRLKDISTDNEFEKRIVSEV